MTIRRPIYGFGLTALVLAFGLFISSPLVRAEDKPDAAIAQGFSTKDEVVRGTLVSINPDESRTVEVANRQHIDRLIGVVTKLPVLGVSDENTTVQVVTSGLAYALVSNTNGEVKQGDYITVSAFSGIGAKAITGTRVVGVAHSDFSDAQQVKEHTVRDSEGKDQTIRVGLMPVDVSPTYYEPPSSDTSLIPSFLQQFANSVAGQTVSPIRVIISIVIFLSGLSAIGILFYSSVRFSITAIGRNPLSAQAVHKGLLQVTFIGVFVLLVTLIAVYLILVI